MQNVIEFFSTDDFSADVNFHRDSRQTWVGVTLGDDNGRIKIRCTEDQARELLGKLANELARPDLAGASDDVPPIEATYEATDLGVAALDERTDFNNDNYVACGFDVGDWVKARASDFYRRVSAITSFGPESVTLETDSQVDKTTGRFLALAQAFSSPLNGRDDDWRFTKCDSYEVGFAEAATLRRMA
jgi:hypothetical protein